MIINWCICEAMKGQESIFHLEESNRALDIIKLFIFPWPHSFTRILGLLFSVVISIKVVILPQTKWLLQGSIQAHRKNEILNWMFSLLFDVEKHCF